MCPLPTGFTEEQAIVSSVAKTHDVIRGKLAGSPKTWILKKMVTEDGKSEPKTANKELIAQEFFRLIISGQPETRLIRGDPPYILSEEIRGYKPFSALPPGKKPTGLGQIVVVSMFLQEVDLKNGNVCIDENNRVRKIDGDCCFSSLYNQHKDKPFNITREAIETLPWPSPRVFYTFNWLDCVSAGTMQAESSLVSRKISQPPNPDMDFLNEVNQALLSICLIPDEYLEAFVDAYDLKEDERAELVNFLQERRKELELNALSMPRFQAYLKTEALQKDKEDLLTRMQEMVAQGTTHVVDKLKNKVDLKDKIDKKLIDMQQTAAEFERLEGEIKYYSEIAPCIAKLQAYSINTPLASKLPNLFKYIDELSLIINKQMSELSAAQSEEQYKELMLNILAEKKSLMNILTNLEVAINDKDDSIGLKKLEEILTSAATFVGTAEYNLTVKSLVDRVNNAYLDFFVNGSNKDNLLRLVDETHNAIKEINIRKQEISSVARNFKSFQQDILLVGDHEDEDIKAAEEFLTKHTTLINDYILGKIDKSQFNRELHLLRETIDTIVYFQDFEGDVATYKSNYHAYNESESKNVTREYRLTLNTLNPPEKPEKPEKPKPPTEDAAP